MRHCSSVRDAAERIERVTRDLPDQRWDGGTEEKKDRREAISSLLLPFLGSELLIRFINQRQHEF